MARRSDSTVSSVTPARGCGRVSLTVEEILQLDAALTQAFRTIEALRTQYPAARHIKFPPLPQVFSESIIIAAAHRLFGAGWKGTYGGMACDVLVRNSQGDQKHTEVKATGQNAFQEFKAKDLRADVLIWMHFGRRFQEGSGPIEVVLLSEPWRFITQPCRLDRVRFERRVGSTDCLRELYFDSLEELLLGGAAEA